ncbi:MAG: DUF3489 domain-containing protein [Sphingobium sp.]
MQLVLLSTAASRLDGNLLPPAGSLGRYGERIRRSVESLIKKAFAIEVPVNAKEQSWREDADQLFGVSITDLGRTAINGDAPEECPPPPGATKEVGGADAFAEHVVPRNGSKVATVLALLQREQGATLTELVDATGWLPHTTRAALTSLRKKGHVIAKGKRDDVTCYSILVAG